MCAVGVETVGGGGNQLFAAVSGAFADVGHANGMVHLSAEAAEDALAEIEPSCALDVGVLVTDRAGGADVGGGAGVLPVGEIDLGTSARVSGEGSRRFRVARGDDAGAKAFAEDLEHGQ